MTPASDGGGDPRSRDNQCPIDGVSASDGGGICVCRAFSFTYPWAPLLPSLASDGGGIGEGIGEGPRDK